MVIYNRNMNCVEVVTCRTLPKIIFLPFCELHLCSWFKFFSQFLLQYAILLTIVVTIQMKYILHIVDLRSENPWDNKAVYLLYTELITGNTDSILFTKPC